MKLARYVGGGRIEIRDEPQPTCPEGGLLVKTLACGLCSGELMDWYMEKKIPHVLGHEVSGTVIESQDPRFPAGSLVFPHHHAPCLQCDLCRKGLHVHCEQWKRTKLIPGGMAEIFGVPAGNLNDTHIVNDIRPIDAALIEPLACIAKSLSLSGTGVSPVGTRGVSPLNPEDAEPMATFKPDAGAGRALQPTGETPVPLLASYAVIGLGALGLMHLLALRASGAKALVGYDFSESRQKHAQSLGLQARHPDQAENADVVFVCPGSPQAVNQAIAMANPGGTIILFAPMSPGELAPIDLNQAYFKDLKLASSYSCGPNDTAAAIQWIRDGALNAEQVVSDFTGMDQLPEKYLAMKAGDILKAMVVFD